MWFGKVMGVSLVVVSSLGGFLLRSAFAEPAGVGPGLISATQVSAIAKDSVAREVGDLNQALADPSAKSAYPGKVLKSFMSGTHKSEIDPDEMYEKCAYGESDLVNLADPVLRPEDDATAGKMSALASVGALYGKDAWKLFSQACRLAQGRFEQRVSELTSNGTALNLDANEVKALSSIVFFPTLAGSAPSLKKEVWDTLFNTLVMGSLVFGPISALDGMAIGNDFILIATASNMGNGLLAELVSAFRKTPNEKLGELLSRSPIDVNLDLNPSEQAQVETLK